LSSDAVVRFRRDPDAAIQHAEGAGDSPVPGHLAQRSLLILDLVRRLLL
jgi:hypothetical protein